MQLVCTLTLFASFICGYTLAAVVSNRVALIEQHTIDRTVSFEEMTRMLRDLKVFNKSLPVSGKSLLHNMVLLPVEMRETIIAEPWKSSSLAALPVEMLPFLTGVRHVIVDNVSAFAAVFNEFQKLKMINLTPLDWRRNDKLDLMLMVKVLVTITERQVERPSILGLNELFIASIFRSQYEVVVVLLSTPQLRAVLITSLEDNYAIRRASEDGRADVVELLLADANVDPAARNNFAICMGSQNGHTEVVKLLLAHHLVDPTVRRNYAIRMASEYGHYKVVQLLLKDGRADPTAENNYAMHEAWHNGHSKVAKLLRADFRVNPAARNNFTCTIL